MPEQQLDLNQTHPLYKRASAVRETARDLFSGAEAVRAKGPLYLYKGSVESNDLYNLRLKRAVFDNWVKVAVLTRVALTWRKRPSREKTLPKSLVAFIEDIDGKGTHADVFFKNVDIDASVDGMTWVKVDKTRKPDLGRPLSAQEERELNLRPFMTSVPAGNVLDWHIGKDGALDWLVEASGAYRIEAPGKERSETEKRTIWYRGHFEVYDVKKENNKSIFTKNEEESGDHDLGVVPFVPFYGNKECDYLGWPVATDVLGHNLAIYNKYSDRDAAEFLSNNPRAYAICPERPELLNANVDNGIWIKAEPGVQCDIGYLEPTGAGLTSSRESERDLIRRIHETMLQQAKRDTAQVESADTLREEARIFNSSLMSHAFMLMQQERICWRLMAKWQRVDESAVKNPEYNTDFDDSIVEAAVIGAFSAAAEKKQISKRTFFEDVLKSGEAVGPDRTWEEEARQILRENLLDADSIMPGFGGRQTRMANTEEDQGNGNE